MGKRGWAKGDGQKGKGKKGRGKRGEAKEDGQKKVAKTNKMVAKQ